VVAAVADLKGVYESYLLFSVNVLEEILMRLAGCVVDARDKSNLHQSPSVDLLCPWRDP